MRFRGDFDGPVFARGDGALKWSQKIGQAAKVYPEPLKGYGNGETPELYGRV